MSPIPFFARHPRADLSAYIDDQLPQGRAAAVRAHLASCDACRAEADGLRETRAALNALPRADAPRSFALTPQHLAAPARPAPRRPERVAPAFFGMRIASAGIAVALALVFVADLSGGSSNDTTTAGDSAALEMTAANTESSGLAPEAGGDGGTFSQAAPITEDNKEVSPTAAAGGVGAAPTGEPASPDQQLGAATEQPADIVAGVPTAADERAADGPTSELAANALADSGATGDNSDGLSALQIAEIVLAVTLAAAVTGGFLVPLALRGKR